MKLRKEDDSVRTIADILFTQASATVEALDQSIKKVYSIKIGVFFGQEKRKVFDTLKSAFNAAVLEAILLDYLIKQSRIEEVDKNLLKAKILIVKNFFVALSKDQPMVGVFHDILYDRAKEVLKDPENQEENPIFRIVGILLSDVVMRLNILEPSEPDTATLDRDLKIIHLCQVPAIFRVQRELGW